MHIFGFGAGGAAFELSGAGVFGLQGPRLRTISPQNSRPLPHPYGLCKGGDFDSDLSNEGDAAIHVDPIRAHF